MIDKLQTYLDKAKDAAASAAVKAEQRDKYGEVSSRDTLIDIVKKRLNVSKFVIVSNREPYMHVYEGEEIKCIRYASGLTIALDSLASACNGLWIAAGTGEADKEVVDEKGNVAVPPEDPKYTLKRLWLTKEEEEGYYYGFSNEVLWPLCHIAHIRPKFKASYWKTYQDVNKLFAEKILEEIKDEKAIIFLQDYHLSLCAKYLKEKNPGLTVILFWHIPWPNPEIFRICPWKIELLNGLLANDIIGFHLRYHGDNFLKTVALELEAKIDYERWMVERGNQKSFVKSYPISSDFDYITHEEESLAAIKNMERLKKHHRIKGMITALGVDRIDYTKGIPERLSAIERFLEKYPEYEQKFVYIQIGVPSRTNLEDYQNLVDEMEKMIEKINWKYSKKNWKPIIYLKGQQDFKEILPFYKLADICIVSSLHDGMNLVAKEFVSSRSDLTGALILSRFAGAARELEHALLINPYDIESFADTIKTACEMPPEEKKTRMQRMRETVSQHNIYDWAITIINDVVKLHQGQLDTLIIPQDRNV